MSLRVSSFLQKVKFGQLVNILQSQRTILTPPGIGEPTKTNQVLIRVVSGRSQITSHMFRDYFCIVYFRLVTFKA